MDAFAYLVIVLLCLAFSAFFSASETALLRLPASDVARDVEAARGPGVVAARDLTGSTSRLLVTILLGNNVANIVGASVASALAVHYLGDRAGIAVASATMTFVVLVFCEVLPKALAARHPRRISYNVALPLYLLHQLLRPVHRLFDRMIEPLVKTVTGGTPGEPIGTSEDILRLARLVPQDHPKGTPHAIIAATARAAHRTVEEIMVPRTSIVAFPVTTSPAEMLEHVLEERYTRLPVYEGSIDRIRGLVHLRDLVNLVHSGGTSVDGILKPVLSVPERKPILPLLAEMQRSFVHLAVVQDEFGVTQGMVSQEDILEELVGEIRDEFDLEELLSIRPRPDGSYLALAHVKVLDFNRETGWNVSSERGDTLGGLVFNALGHAPARGDVVNVPGYEISVVNVAGARIAQVRVCKLATADTDGDAERADGDRLS
jgi:putative hemolysin